MKLTIKKKTIKKSQCKSLTTDPNSLLSNTKNKRDYKKSLRLHNKRPTFAWVKSKTELHNKPCTTENLNRSTATQTNLHFPHTPHRWDRI